MENNKSMKTLTISDTTYEVVDAQARNDIENLPIAELCEHTNAKGKEFSSGLYKITTNEQGHVTAATDVTKEDIVNLGVIGEIPQSDWTQTDSSSTDYIKNKPDIKQGAGENSVVIGIGNAQGDYSLAGGTNDKDLVGDMVGSSIVATLTSIDKAQATGPMSMAYGAGVKSLVAGTMALGVNSTAGSKGFYWHNFDFKNNIITLSTVQKPYYTTSVTAFGQTVTKEWNKTSTWTTNAATQLANWAVGDKLAITNSKKYVYCSSITAINSEAGTITVDDLPFTVSTASATAVLTYNFEDCAVYNLTHPTYGVVDFGYGSFSLGYNNKAVGTFSTALGYENTASDLAFITGKNNIGGCMSFASGYNNQATGETTLASGKENIVMGNNASARGYGNKVYGHAGHAEGHSNIVGVETSPNGTDYGYDAHAEGSSNIASGNFSHAEGYGGCTASGIGSHAEGKATKASGGRAHAEGDSTEATGNNSHAEGYLSKATAAGAHAEGYSTIASGTQSHAEGKSVIVLADKGHGEGYSTKNIDELAELGLDVTTADKDEILDFWRNTQKFNLVRGKVSHSEGEDTLAWGEYVHAEGYQTLASGLVSHAEGWNTEATAWGSHSEGRGTIANGEYQHVQGKWNETDTENKYAHIIGGGTSDSARKNIHTVDWEGNSWYSGTVEATAIILKSSTEGSEKQFKITVNDDGTLNAVEVE